VGDPSVGGASVCGQREVRAGELAGGDGGVMTWTSDGRRLAAAGMKACLAGRSCWQSGVCYVHTTGQQVQQNYCSMTQPVSSTTNR
jgi:hypothetical protein